MKIKGFTLIELLVVISIIALLLAILMPGLQKAKELASGVVCTNNQKSLCTAWVLYADDNDGNLVGGSTYNQNDWAQRATPYRWVEPPLLNPIYNDSGRPGVDAGGSWPNYSEKTRLNGIRAGKLFTYLESEKVYHCPGDRTFRNPEPHAVYRSYGISGLMNGEDFMARDGEFGKITGFRSVTLDGQSKLLKVATKSTDIRSPGLKFVFVEEDAVTSHNQPYNMGGWVHLDGGYSWWDVPAGYHSKGGTIGFADGHAERIKWKDPDTIALIEEGTGTADPDPSANEDLRWLAKGYIPMP